MASPDPGDASAGPSGRPSSSSSSQSPPPPSPPPPCRACVGATFYNRERARMGAPPRCAGLSKRLAADLEVEPAALPPDVAPHGDFSFVCLGYSVYTDADGRPVKKEGDSSTSTPRLPGPGEPDDVALPQCLGVQIIRAQAVRAAPLPATAGGEAATTGKAATSPPRPPRRDPLARGADGPATAPSLPSPGDALAALPDAAGRLGRSARRVAEQMGRNAGAGLAAARKAAESLADAVLPGRDK